MRDCLIMGSGRSGTSLLAGVLSESGYFMGSRLHAANDANPKGFFEDKEINRINESILETVAPGPPRGPLGRLYKSRLRTKQRWLARVDVGYVPEASDEVSQRIRSVVSHRPFCFKDPRFCYTLEAWRGFIGDAALLCIFREPGRTVQSILKECATAPYLSNLSMTPERALDVWKLMYRNVLEVHRHSGDWMFVHYDQVLDGSSGPRIKHLLDAEPNMSFAERSLKRTKDDYRVDEEADEIYRRLCNLAGHSSAPGSVDTESPKEQPLQHKRDASRRMIRLE